MRKSLWLAAILCSALTCSAGFAKRTSPGYHRVLSYFEVKPNLKPGTFRILDEQKKPIPRARVLIGMSVDDPFKGNFVSTDANGRIKIPTAWNSPLPVTIEAPGFVRTTYMSISPENLISLMISRRPIERPQVVSGTATQFDAIPSDGNAYFALVTPTLLRGSLFDFEPNRMVSPLNDRLQMMGQDVPVSSNLAFPNQRQSYFLFTFNLDKPRYRLLNHNDEQRHFVATRGRFPFSQVAGDLRSGRKLYDLFNSIEFLSSGTNELTTSTASFDIPVNQQKFSSRVTVRRPPGLSSTALVFAVALSPLRTTGSYIPSDLKRLEPQKTVSMVTPANPEEGLTMGILKPKDPILANDRSMTVSQAMTDLQMSVVVKRASDPKDFDFLPLISKPIVHKHEVVSQPPQAPFGFTPLGSYVTLTRIRTLKENGEIYEHAAREWQFFAEGWVNQTQIPDWPVNDSGSDQWRWDVYFLGTQEEVVAPSLGPQMFNQATHVVRNSTQL